MATLAAGPAVPALQRERTFYFRISLVFLATAIAGFGFFAAIGASRFDAPLWVHVHALTMVAFLALYVAQNWLVHRGEIAAHRELGVVGAALSVWLVAYGSVMITWSLATARFPPFFSGPFFLLLDWLNMIVFVGLAGAGLVLRERSAWHKRLMFGAMLSLMSVAWGRLILPPFFDQRAIAIVLAIQLLHLAVAMRFDRRVHGQVHPAHYWTGAALVGWIALLFAFHDLPAWAGFAESFAA